MLCFFLGWKLPVRVCNRRSSSHPGRENVQSQHQGCTASLPCLRQHLLRTWCVPLHGVVDACGSNAFRLPHTKRLHGSAWEHYYSFLCLHWFWEGVGLLVMCNIISISLFPIFYVISWQSWNRILSIVMVSTPYSEFINMLVLNYIEKLEREESFSLEMMGLSQVMTNGGYLLNHNSLFTFTYWNIVSHYFSEMMVFLNLRVNFLLIFRGVTYSTEVCIQHKDEL